MCQLASVFWTLFRGDSVCLGMGVEPGINGLRKRRALMWRIWNVKFEDEVLKWLRLCIFNFARYFFACYEW